MAGLYLAISAVITQWSQRIFFLVSSSVLRCRILSWFGLSGLRCIVWWRGLRRNFWLLHRFLFRIFGTLCYVHKYYKGEKAMDSEKSHSYSVMNELHLHRAPSASMNVCYTYTKYLPLQLSAATQTERRQNALFFFFWILLPLPRP